MDPDMEMDDGSDPENARLDYEMELEEQHTLTNQERLLLAKRRRAEQLKRWAQREREWIKGPVNGHGAKGRRRKAKGVVFEPSIVLLEAAARNDLEEVRNLLEMGVSPDSTNEDGLTALHQCCIDDSEEMMKILIDYGGNPNATDTEKWTPLHAAATCGHLHLVKFLIDSGAELLSVNLDGNMPYDLCEDETTLRHIENEMARRGVTQDLIDETRSETERRMLRDLQVLQMNGGDLDTKDPSCNATPLHIASANGFLSVVEFLLEHHVSTDVTDEDLWQPIHAATWWGHLEIVELLAQNGANIDAKTKNGETPLDICEDPDIKERLIQLKEQTLLRGTQPRVRRTRSASTRTHSIRRTSLRDKMNTTKRDVQDEKLHFMHSLDPKSNKLPDSNGVVDIKDVELTILPPYGAQDSTESQAESLPPHSNTKNSDLSPPQRPPRNHGGSGDDKSAGHFVNRVMLSPNSREMSPSPMISVKVRGTSPSKDQSPQQRLTHPGGHSHLTAPINNNTADRSPVLTPQQHSSNMQSQTLSDLKKIRQMSRGKVPSPKQPAHPQPSDGGSKRDSKLSLSSPQQSLAAQSNNVVASNASRFQSDMQSPGAMRSIHHSRRSNHGDSSSSFVAPPGRKSSKSRGHSSSNIHCDEDRVQQDLTGNRKFTSSNEVVGPSFKKKSCCKIM